MTMIKGMKKSLLLIMMVVFSFALSACATEEAAPAVEEAAEEVVAADTIDTETETEEAGPIAKGLKVATVLGGPITDKSWNETQYRGLLHFEEMGAEIAYMENTSVTDAPDVIRTFAAEGFDVIYIGSASFKDAAVALAEEFPDTTFMMMNGGVMEANKVNVKTADFEQGFLQGFICAMVTDTDTVGWVGGLEISPTLNSEAGFKQGVAYANEVFGTEIKAVTALTGSFTDIEAAKETTLAMIQNGAGAISGMADDATHGILSAAEESSVPCVGTGSGQEEIAPTMLITGIPVDNEYVYVSSFTKFLDGSVNDYDHAYGVAAGAVYLTELAEGAAILTDEQFTAIDDVIKGITDDSIVVKTAVEFEQE